MCYVFTITSSRLLLSLQICQKSLLTGWIQTHMTFVGQVPLSAVSTAVPLLLKV